MPMTLPLAAPPARPAKRGAAIRSATVTPTRPSRLRIVAPMHLPVVVPRGLLANTPHGSEPLSARAPTVHRISSRLNAWVRPRHCDRPYLTATDRKSVVYG